MFTGIIQSIGKVVKFDRNQLWIETPFRGIRKGESIAVDGVCLTVTRRRKRDLAFDVGRVTRQITTLGGLAPGSRVNLERALRVGDRLGGHWVSGHVEDTGRILRIRRSVESWMFTFSLPEPVRRYTVTKGSLAVDGISLTVVSARRGQANIMIIPHTLSHTTLGKKKVGDWVNLEPDLLAKYALRRRSGDRQ